MKLYHITPGSNVHSIGLHGLVPAFKNGLTSSYVVGVEEWRKTVVWLTDDVDYIINNQASSFWVEENKAVVLEIDCSSLDIEHRSGFYDDHEYLHYGVIPPELITEQKLVDISALL